MKDLGGTRRTTLLLLLCPQSICCKFVFYSKSSSDLTARKHQHIIIIYEYMPWRTIVMEFCFYIKILLLLFCNFRIKHTVLTSYYITLRATKRTAAVLPKRRRLGVLKIRLRARLTRNAREKKYYCLTNSGFENKIQHYRWYHEFYIYVTLNIKLRIVTLLTFK